MEREAEFGVALAVAVVDRSRARGPESPRLSEVLDPAWLDDAACASEMQAVAAMRARLDAYEIGVVARLADLRPDVWQDADDPGHGADGWTAQREFCGVSEFFVDEVALVLGISRTRAHTVANTALVLVHQLPATWHALADGLIDLPRARALVTVLGWQQPDVSAEVIGAVEAEALAWAISGEGPYRLQNRTAALLLEHDAAAADRARKEAARTTDVTLQGRRDGLTDLTITLEPDVAAACRDATDRYARMWKADGDDRPVGQLRTLVAADLLLRAWDTSRPPVTAHITIHAPLPSLRPPSCTPAREPAEPGAVDEGVERCGTVGGQPVTSAHLRELLRRWTDAGLDGLHAPEGGSLDIALTDPGTGELRAVVTEPELRRAARRPCPLHHADPAGCGCPALDRPPPTAAYRPTAAQRRFVAARDRGCRHPGCSRPAIWTDLDHVTAHDAGGPTDCANLCTLCRRHHRLKTHAPGWRFAMTGDGMLSVTTPSGVTRTTRPPGTGPGLTRLDQLLHPDEETAELDLEATTSTPDPDEDPPPF
ncbi:HNH endonuclease signature motif containing protein [Klenkia sp. PcliD-1-E]|uniref:HNH endonuclease signature motif containing protein n=1 Tax=Klenkia sp. PcliD-1-E TaxID=2954492 RepID=UPI00209843B7|nr:HNH endonuclease signature motif containing protein [Klenkia sp. PcliD-1-E]MCO7219722.1 HNH endonuclease [Klenkia sp. PcliD-1-E]